MKTGREKGRKFKKQRRKGKDKGRKQIGTEKMGSKIVK
jgi:hypothetical protein